jgi:hypothetical protein
LQVVGPVVAVCNFLGLSSSYPFFTGKFPCSCCFSMVGVPASKFYCRPSLYVLLVSVPGNHASCNAEGFTKSSWEPSEEGTIRRGVVAVDAFILWVGKLCLPVLFMLNKVIVLFISMFSSHLLWGLGGIRVEKKKVERYI